MQRQYMLYVKDKNGEKVYLTMYPMSHKKCCVMKSKFSPRTSVRIVFEEV
jgi:hypothetical protein